VRLLLDTNILIWRMSGGRKLHARTAERLRGAEEVLVSVVSFVELGVKMSTGKLRLPVDVRRHVLESGARILGLSPEHGLALAELPPHHRDPFDRLLISQALSEGLTILTADHGFQRYDVPVLLAGG
jgi:PIN domain nuclease of toxin-antitoxin system